MIMALAGGCSIAQTAARLLASSLLTTLGMARVSVLLDADI